MKIKNFICLMLCATLLLCTTACRKTGDALSSAYSNGITNINTSTDISTVSQTTEENSTQSSGNNTSTPSESSNTQSTTSIDFEKMYGLKSLESVDYECYKDIPNGEAQYEILEVLNEKGQDLKISCDYTCDSKDIKIDGFIVSVPASYKEKHKSVKLTATHRLSGIKLDFEIKFENNYKLIFEDNFDGDSLNTEVWGDIWDTGIDAEQRDDYSYGYVKENVFVDGKGHLINRVKAMNEKNSKGQPTYTTSLISTKNCFESRYGYYEMSVRPHLTTGLWGAFWILAGDMDNDNAPEDNSTKNGVEIDIFETLMYQKTARHALFWDGYGWFQNESGDWVTKTQGHGVMAPEMPEIYDGNFHKFALQWTPTEFIFLIDDQVTYRWTNTDGCNMPGYMLISSHINSEGTGELLLKPGEYTDMIVDYVRVYESTPYSD